MNIHPAGMDINPLGNSMQDTSRAVQRAKQVGERDILPAIIIDRLSTFVFKLLHVVFERKNSVP